MPLVTVIIATYNSSAALRLALESALRQDLQELEVWVVGDACTDDSAEVVSAVSDPRVRWTNLETNSGGPARPRNEALKVARGRYVAYLGHDDLWFPDHLSGLVDTLEATQADFGYSLAVCTGPNGVTSSFTIREEPLRWTRPLSPSNWLHRRDLIDRIGPFDVRVRLGDDAQFLQRVKDSGARLAFHNKLTTVKFPAETWRAYAAPGEPAQTPYARAMCENPNRLREQLLSEAAVVLSNRDILAERSALGLKGLPRTLAIWACDLYGRQRWPLNELLYRQWRRGAGLGAERSRVEGKKP
jgi:glycosyltransferase involved in cell wall biosynthesis